MLVGVYQVEHFKSKPYEDMGHNVTTGVGSSIQQEESSTEMFSFSTAPAPDPDSFIKP